MEPVVWMPPVLDLVLAVVLIGCAAGLGALIGRMVIARKADRTIDSAMVGTVAALTVTTALLVLWVSTR